MTGRRRGPVVLAVAVGATGLGGLPVWLLSAHAPTMTRVLGFDEAVLGLIVSGFFVCSALTGMVAGRFVQARGWRAGVVATGLLAAAGMLGVGLLGGSVLSIMAFLVLGAVANATSQPAANLAVSSSVGSARHGVAFGIKQAALPIATFVVGASLPLFVGDHGWRRAYVVGAAVALGVVACGLLVGRRGSAGPRPDGARGRTIRVDPSVRRGLLLMAVGGGFGTACTMSLGGFLVVSVVASGWSEVAAGRLLAAASVVGITSRVVSGALADRRTGRHLVAVASMMLAGVGGLVLLALSRSVALTVVGALLAYGLGWAWNGVFAYATVRYSGGAPAVATGIVQSAMSVGAAVGPLTFGVLATGPGYPTAWLVAAGTLALGAGFVLLGRRALPPGAATVGRPDLSPTRAA